MFFQGVLVGDFQTFPKKMRSLNSLGMGQEWVPIPNLNENND
jgi:hypothetical protein